MNQRNTKYQRLKRRFMWQQIYRGVVAVLMIMALILLFSYLFEDMLGDVRCYLLKHKWLLYLSLLLSELLGSLLPPEFFILALSRESIWVYTLGVLFFSILSYGAAIVVYFLGHSLQGTRLFKRLVARYFLRELRQVKRFGGLLIILAALTPISFTVICFLVGATGFSYGYFLRYAAVRYLRFLFYGVSLWHTVTPTFPC